MKIEVLEGTNRNNNNWTIRNKEVIDLVKEDIIREVSNGILLI